MIHEKPFILILFIKIFKVQICVRLKCQPLPEDKFKELLADNYYTHNHFWFELDHEQTSRLISLLSSGSIVCGNSVSQNTPSWVTSSRETWREDETFKMLELETKVVENEDEVNRVHEDEVNSVHLKLKELTVSYLEQRLVLFSML